MRQSLLQISYKLKQKHKEYKHRLKNSSPKFLEWRETILDVLSNLNEASIDFSEEDLPEGILKNNEEKIKSIVSDIDEMLDETMGEIIRDGFKIAIIGPQMPGNPVS